jgi:hypothetical protein
MVIVYSKVDGNNQYTRYALFRGADALALSSRRNDQDDDPNPRAHF